MAESFEVVATIPDEQQRNPANRRIGHVILREAAALTTSYVASDHTRVTMARRVSLLFTSAWASATSIEYYVEWSWDGTTFFRSVNIATSGATNTLTENLNTLAVGAAKKWIDSFEVQAPYIRVYAKRTGGAAGDTLAIDVLSVTT